jgi:hypothetical protein
MYYQVSIIKGMTLEQIDDKFFSRYGKVRSIEGIEGLDKKDSIVQAVKLEDKE